MIQYKEIKVLLIEDFADYAGAVVAMISAMGCEHVDHVISAESAIQKCREITYDLILSDYNLGEGKDGQQLFEELRHFKVIPDETCFIMITAEKTASMVMAAIESRPDSYLAKPFNRQLLKSRIDKSIIKKEKFKHIKKAIHKKDWTKVLKLYHTLSDETSLYRQDLKKINLTILKNTKTTQDCQDYLESELNERVTPWALNELGKSYFSLKQYDKAENTFKRMLIEFPYALEGYDWLAKIQAMLHRPSEAQQTIEKAIKRSPKLIKRQKMLGELAELNGDNVVMMQAYRQAVKQSKYSIFSHPDEYVKLTKSIGVSLKTVGNEERDKLITEAKSVFLMLHSKFSKSTSTQLRGAVAHADFSSIIDDRTNVLKQIEIANNKFENIDENIGTNECLEIATSLQQLGFSELAEKVLEDGVEQYFDQKHFMTQVKKITTNEDLISRALKIDAINKRAVKYFKEKQYDRSLEQFLLAISIAPNNINIALNRAQALLKKYQLSKKNSNLLDQAERILSDIDRLSADDLRYKRYLELLRLSELMLQNSQI